MSDILAPVCIAGSGSYLPDRAVDNYELYELATIREAFDVERARGSLRGLEPEATAALNAAEVFDRWALQVTGIARRRIFDREADTSTEWMCAEACRRALKHARMEARDVDLVVVASLTEAEVVPNAACTVGDLLGIPDVGGYALNAACAGFVYALATAYAFIASGVSTNVLVVSGDVLSTITNYTDPATAVLFGDGAGAVVLSSNPGPGTVLGPPYLVADYSPTHLRMDNATWLPREEPLPTIAMAGGPHVLRNAIKAMMDASERALDRANSAWDDVDVVIPHQANQRITQGIAKILARRGIRVVDTIEDYGNMSASTVPIALDELLKGRHGELPQTSRIVLTAVGGGYTTGAAVLELQLTPDTGLDGQYLRQVRSQRPPGRAVPARVEMTGGGAEVDSARPQPIRRQSLTQHGSVDMLLGKPLDSRQPGVSGIPRFEHLQASIAHGPHVGALLRDDPAPVGIGRVQAYDVTEVARQPGRDLGPGVAAVVGAIGAAVALLVEATDVPRV